MNSESEPDFDNTCSICFDIFYYPVTTEKCSHSFCKECLMGHVNSCGFTCPNCRGRLNGWLRKVALKKTNFVDEQLWLEIQNKYPDKVKQRRQEEDGYAPTVPVASTSKAVTQAGQSFTRPPVTLSKPGEIKKEFDELLRKEKEEFEREELSEQELSEAFIKLIQDDEARELEEEWWKRNPNGFPMALRSRRVNLTRSEHLQENEQRGDQTQENVESIASTSNTQNSSFSCSNCLRTYSLQTSLRAHQRLCSRDFPRVRVELTRLSEETITNAVQVRPVLNGIKCSICDKRFSCQKHLKNHKLIHSGIKPFSCTQCDKPFTLKKNLKEHQLTHSGTKSFACLECNKSYFQKKGLRQHMLTHTGEKPFSCPVCKKSFYFKSRMTRHQTVHSDVKKYTCSDCGLSFKRKSNITVHMYRKHLKVKLGCTKCEKSFNSKFALKDHERHHPGTKSFACMECNKMYFKKQDLKLHMLTHTGEKPTFSCPVCEKTFISKSKLARHQTIHSKREMTKHL